VLLERLPRLVDGKTAILEMKKEGSPNWRQMEWIGFWFEHFVDEVFLTESKGLTGPKFGKTQFDMMLSTPWDLKAHPSDISKIILNDKSAVDACISEFGAINYLLISGRTEYDDEERSFKTWHDSIKGGVSKYETTRVNEGRPSRRRKVSFAPTQLFAFSLDRDSLDGAIQNGTIGSFQEGMRNSNGKPRNGKYMLKFPVETQAFENYRVEID
jgi:hypothetical protein